jgi:hypothetical protein
VSDLWGRSIIVHADKDDLGKGGKEDSLITGHSGKRLGCALFGRTHMARVHTRRRPHAHGTRKRRTTGTRKAASIS